ncbi:MAG: amidohydrolase family protein [Opitutales bacterium]
MVIDCHTHCFPHELGENPRAWASPRNEPHWADLVAPRGRTSIQDWTSPEKMLRAMDEASVDQAVLLGWYWESEATCRWHNEQIASWCAQAPGRFIGYASIRPNHNTIAQLQDASALGLCGVGELHPGVQGFNSASPGWKALAHWCTQHNWPVNFHCTRPVGDHPLAVATPLADYALMLREHPDLNFIFAHWGAGLPQLLQDHPPDNAYYDCSASPLLYDEGIFRSVLAQAGAGQILFGSDYPLRIYPRESKRAEMARFIANIRSRSCLPPKDIEALLGGNFERLRRKK